MSNTLDQLEPDRATSELPYVLPLELAVEDRDTIAELWKYPEGSARDEFALEALKIGVLTLRRASSSLDTDFIKRETDRLLKSLQEQFRVHADSAKEKIEGSLGQYFHPESGQFTQRVRQLTAADGELDKVIRSLVDGEDSRLAKTLLSQIGENSPLMKQLSPDQSQGLLALLRTTVEMQLSTQRERLLKEFSLDNSEGALCRLLKEITTKHGDFTDNMKSKIDEVVKEFSLDKKDSALSKLVEQVNTAQLTITKEFSLDNEASALQKLKRELMTILEAQVKSSADFQEKVQTALTELVTTRKVEARGTQHGTTFEDALYEIISTDAQSRGDVAENTGDKVGLMKRRQVGDIVVQLGSDCAAAGARIVIEAKENASYTLANALAEMDEARKNRGAQYGIFVFSKTVAPTHLQPFSRHGNDIVVIWDANDTTTDAYLKAALEACRALCVRDRNTASQSIDFTVLDKSLLEIESKVANLEKIRKSAETIQNSSKDILDRVRIDSKALDEQLAIMRACVHDLKSSLSTEEA